MMMLENNLFDDFVGGEIIEYWNENQITEWKSKFSSVFFYKYCSLLFIFIF